MRHILVFVCLFLAAGCIPYSDIPLTDPGREKIDASICETWYWNEGDEWGYIHMGIDKNTNLLQVVMLECDRGGRFDVSEFAGHTSSLAKNRYLNLKWVRPAGKTQGYFFVKYSVDGDSLRISLMGTEAIKDAIKQSLLKGKVTDGQWTSSIRITEAQERLQQFVVEKDKALFEEESRLRRLRLPSNR